MKFTPYDPYILTVLITLTIGALVRLLHKGIQRVMGYRWWYRNVYLRTPHWRLTRRWLIFLAGYHCAQCKRVQPTKWEKRHHSLDVHHIKNGKVNAYQHLWWEWAHPRQMQVLCRYHHSLKHQAGD